MSSPHLSSITKIPDCLKRLLIQNHMEIPSCLEGVVLAINSIVNQYAPHQIFSVVENKTTPQLTHKGISYHAKDACKKPVVVTLLLEKEGWSIDVEHPSNDNTPDFPSWLNPNRTTTV